MRWGVRDGGGVSIPGEPVLAKERMVGTVCFPGEPVLASDCCWVGHLLPALGLSDEVGRVSLDFGLDGLPDVCGGLGVVECWVLCCQCPHHGNGLSARPSEVFNDEGHDIVLGVSVFFLPSVCAAAWPLILARPDSTSGVELQGETTAVSMLKVYLPIVTQTSMRSSSCPWLGCWYSP